MLQNKVINKKSKIANPGNEIQPKRRTISQKDSEEKFQDKVCATGPEHSASKLEQEVGSFQNECAQEKHSKYR